MRGAAQRSRPGYWGKRFWRSRGWHARRGARGQSLLGRVRGEGPTEPLEESRDRQGVAEVMGKACAPGCEGRGLQAFFGSGLADIGAPGAAGGKRDREGLREETAGMGPGLGRQGAGGRGQGPCWKRRRRKVAGCKRKQGGSLLGPENGEAVWLVDPSPEGML